MAIDEIPDSLWNRKEDVKILHISLNFIHDDVFKPSKFLLVINTTFWDQYVNFEEITIRDIPSQQNKKNRRRKYGLS